ncbi:Leucine-rich repeat-containing protein 15 [Holothuria leucospilota]|uniref:Leucine-rich repeat-containing protein 15 n=1 Tax=Holothuria leucospilota TaxID=206669 RepID=A0A9Q1CQ52_HOLLE|nr:Leucine-rich repeat-containing protein 15 [Holothuria leucospilota]
MILVLLPVHGTAACPAIRHELRGICQGYVPKCSEAGWSREDDVLDANDVKIGLDGETFDGSGKNFTMVCSNAFHHVHVELVNLTNNLLQDLPCGIFDYTQGPERVYLDRNKFTSIPSALNSSDVKLLVLSNNKISEIPKGTMNGMEGLTTLSLSGNQNMTQIPEDIFILSMCCSLNHGVFTNTKIEYPLVPAPQDDVLCTTDNPCNVKHTGSLIVVRPRTGNKVTFNITQNGAMRCQELKQQIEADYNIVNGSISCDNNGLGGSVEIVRKSKHDTVTDVTNQPDFTTGYAPTTESGKKSNVVCMSVIVLLSVGVGICIIVIAVVMKYKYAGVKKASTHRPTSSLKQIPPKGRKVKAGNAMPNSALNSSSSPLTLHNEES